MIKLLLAASAALAFTFCRAMKRLAPVKLGINKLGAMANIWFASKNGIFKKHGLDLQIVEVPMSDQSIPLLQGKTLTSPCKSPAPQW